MHRIACIALTPAGVELALRIASGLMAGPASVVAEVHMTTRLLADRASVPPAADGHPAEGGPAIAGFVTLADHMRAQFAAYDGFVFVAATGIVVRTLAPLLAGKTSDPAVVVCDQRGMYVISMLSGHLGGANALARQVAALTGGTPVITTATDTENLPAIDLLAQQAGCALRDPHAIKAVSGALLRGEAVYLYDPAGVLDLPDDAARHFVRVHDLALVYGGADDGTGPAGGSACVVVDWRNHPPRQNVLRVVPRVVCGGVGCRRGTACADILGLLAVRLAAADAAPESLAMLASADIKQDEPGLVQAAGALGVVLRCFDSAALAAVDVPTPSPKAAAVLGVERVGVCEAAAMLGAALCVTRGGGADSHSAPRQSADSLPLGVLIAPKAVAGGVTVALAVPATYIVSIKDDA